MFNRAAVAPAGTAFDSTAQEPASEAAETAKPEERRQNHNHAEDSQSVAKELDITETIIGQLQAQNLFFSSEELQHALIADSRASYADIQGAAVPCSAAKLSDCSYGGHTRS